MPVSVGTKNETTVHLRLSVSFLIVINVVEQGQCISEKSITETAVSHVQPFETSSVFNAVRLSNDASVPRDK